MATAEPGRPKVIFLEDDHQLRLGLTDFLRLNSLVVTDVASWADFRDAFAKEPYDIAILDVNLPDGNGFEIARDLSAYHRLGIIVLTARAERADRIKGYEEGADLYFTKPVDGEELVAAIRNLHRRLSRLEPIDRDESNSNQWVPWRFDSVGQSLYSPTGAKIGLSGRETRLIRSLVEAKGEVVRRSDLAAAVGSEDLGAESRSLDAILRRLRQKARQAGTEMPVHAVHGLGFRFSDQITDN